MKRLPTMFIGHGSPMNVIEKNIYIESWRTIGESIVEKPRAILMFSAHWITEGKTRISTSEKPEMIYDMYGFPEELYQLRYSCPGSRKIAEEIIDTLAPDFQIVPDDTRGIDHGVWSVLAHLFPEADIPVIQMSLDYSQSPEWHYRVGEELKNLREEGILIIGSGNIVHNLRAIDWSDKEKYSWAVVFDKRVSDDITSKKYDDILDFKTWDTARLAHPSYDHLLPLFPILGTIDPSDRVEFYTPDITMGSLSMRSVVWR